MCSGCASNSQIVGGTHTRGRSHERPTGSVSYVQSALETDRNLILWHLVVGLKQPARGHLPYAGKIVGDVNNHARKSRHARRDATVGNVGRHIAPFAPGRGHSSIPLHKRRRLRNVGSSSPWKKRSGKLRRRPGTEAAISTGSLQHQMKGKWKDDERTEGSCCSRHGTQ